MFANNKNLANIAGGLKPSDLQVLATIEKNGPLTIPGIHGKINLAKSSIYENLHGKAKREDLGLITRGLVKIKNQETYRTGLTMSTYTLTLRGLIKTIAFSEQPITDLAPTAERWIDLLPKIFRRWELFKRVGLDKDVQSELLHIFKLEASKMWYEKSWFNHDDESNEDGFILEKLIKFFLEQRDEKVVLKWDKVLHQDNGLRNEVDKQYALSRAINEAWINRQKIKDEIMSALNEKDPDWKKIAELESEAVKPLHVSYSYTG